jgi:ABC-type lipoprotein release transport system permease subunit
MLAVAVLIGIAGGAALAGFAGARRTDSTLERFFEHTNEADETIFPLDFRDSDRLDAEAVEQLPGVRAVGSGLGYLLASRSDDGGVSVADNADALASENPEFYDISTPGRLQGRLPDPDRLDEAFVNDVVARDYELQLGSTLHAGVARFSDLLALGDDATAEQFEALFRWVDVKVVGIGRTSDQLLANEGQERGVVVFSPAFAHELEEFATFRVLSVDLESPSAGPRFEAALRDLYPDLPLQVTPRQTKEATFARTVQPYVDALRLFALAAAVTGLLVTIQALARLVAADAADVRVLDALGATRRRRALVSAARAGVAAAIGALLAALIATAASAIFPIGPASGAEVDSGIDVDAVVLSLGALAIAGFLVGAITWTAWRRARFTSASAARAERTRRASVTTDRLAGAGAPVSAVTGVRFALERDRAHGAAPLAVTLFGLVVAIATIGAGLTFGSNLDSLVTTPQRYGWDWDTLIDPGDEGADDELIDEVRRDQDLESATLGTRAVVPIAGRVVPAYGFEPLRGDADLQVLAGRLPRRADEVALGGSTLHDVGRDIGDTVQAHAADGTPTRLRIVGQTAFPSLSLNATYGLGEGAAFTGDGLATLAPDVEPSFFLVNLRDGASLDSVREHYGDELGIEGVRRPGDIESYSRIRATPVVLAGLLAVLGVGVLAHLLVTSIRNRRRDLAVMKTLGCTNCQLAFAVAWQATTLVVLALVVGVPLGIVGGRVVWRAFTEDLGIATTAAIPVVAFTGIVAAAVVVANLIAFAPGRSAARTPAATILTIHDG